MLYHLTKLGWSDVMLIERSELTSGSTWHAAGGFHTLNGDTNMAALQGYTIRLYKELEEITGMSCGLHHVGGLTLADTPERIDMLKAERAKHRYMGLDTEIVGPDEIARMPTSRQHRRGARRALRSARRSSRSLGHHPRLCQGRADGRAPRSCCTTGCWRPTRGPTARWDVVTEKGTIHAEHVVNAAGLWAREVGAMAGVYLPLLPMEHQYLVTDDMPEIYERGDASFPM